MLVLTRGCGAHTILGATLDDSIGEAFDKTIPRHFLDTS